MDDKGAKEMQSLREQVASLAERIHKQAEILARLSEKRTCSYCGKSQCDCPLIGDWCNACRTCGGSGRERPLNQPERNWSDD